jgi:hypothetical protein
MLCRRAAHMNMMTASVDCLAEWLTAICMYRFKSSRCGAQLHACNMARVWQICLWRAGTTSHVESVQAAAQYHRLMIIIIMLPNQAIASTPQTHDEPTSTAAVCTEVDLLYQEVDPMGPASSSHSSSCYSFNS